MNYATKFGHKFGMEFCGIVSHWQQVLITSASKDQTFTQSSSFQKLEAQQEQGESSLRNIRDQLNLHIYFYTNLGWYNKFSGVLLLSKQYILFFFLFFVTVDFQKKLNLCLTITLFHNVVYSSFLMRLGAWVRLYFM